MIKKIQIGVASAWLKVSSFSTENYERK